MMKLILVLASMLVLVGCQTSKVAGSPVAAKTNETPQTAKGDHRTPAISSTPTGYLTGDETLPAPELGEKWGPENEEQTNKIVALFENMLKSETQPGAVVQRDAHPKHHACVTASLTIDPGQLSPELRVGLYAVPSKHDAWIRFSNGSPTGNQHGDIELDQRGMAVKILGVNNSPTGNQDLVMMDDERFFSKDGENYLPMTEALMGGKLGMVKFLALHPHQAEVLLASRHRVSSVLNTSFFSSVPYKLGPKSSRFKMQACDKKNLFTDIPNKKTAAKNYLRERLVATLAKQDACFDLYLEPNNDPAKNKVEDPTRVWDHKVSPFILVGRLEIPKQDGLLSEQQMNFCENVSMDPWRAPLANRPLGQINRIRKLAYPRISGYRHRQNDRARLEPRDLTPCQGETADLCKSRHSN